MESARTQLAVFDYDGTCIDGQSGSLLSQWLLRNGYLSPYATAALAWWGCRYKLHLPYRQEHARELVFRCFAGRPCEEVDRLLARFHNEVLLPRYRPQAQDEIAACRERGFMVVLATATFEPIAAQAAAYLGTDGYIATCMEKDAAGRYTNHVSGTVTAGEGKLSAVHRWADGHLGVGRWTLERAYGDHHTDQELLRAASYPVAVTPGPALKKVAHRDGWPVLEWR